MDLEGQTYVTGQDMVQLPLILPLSTYFLNICDVPANVQAWQTKSLPSWNCHHWVSVLGVTSGLLGPKLEWLFSLEYAPPDLPLPSQCTLSLLVKWASSKVAAPAPFSDPDHEASCPSAP